MSSSLDVLGYEHQAIIFLCGYFASSAWTIKISLFPYVGVDIDAATQHNIRVARIPGSATGNAASCSEMAIYLMMGLLRKQVSHIWQKYSTSTSGWRMSLNLNTCMRTMKPSNSDCCRIRLFVYDLDHSGLWQKMHHWLFTFPLWVMVFVISVLNAPCDLIVEGDGSFSQAERSRNANWRNTSWKNSRWLIFLTLI